MFFLYLYLSFYDCSFLSNYLPDIFYQGIFEQCFVLTRMKFRLIPFRQKCNGCKCQKLRSSLNYLSELGCQTFVLNIHSKTNAFQLKVSWFFISGFFSRMINFRGSNCQDFYSVFQILDNQNRLFFAFMRILFSVSESQLAFLYLEEVLEKSISTALFLTSGTWHLKNA